MNRSPDGKDTKMRERLWGKIRGNIRLSIVLISILILGLLIPFALTAEASGTNYYVDTTYGDDSNSGTIPAKPLLNYSAALEKAKDGDTIMVQRSHGRNVPLVINKSITLTTADKDKDGNSITNKNYIRRASALDDKDTNDIIIVEAGHTLTLKNIEIRGERKAEGTARVGANIYLNGAGTGPGEMAGLILDDGALLTAGNRSGGGGAVFSYYGKIIMKEGSEVSGNFGAGSAFTTNGNEAAGGVRFTEVILRGG